MSSSAALLSLAAQAAAHSALAPGTALLALDLGTRTGWALQERSGRICSGSQPFRPQRYEGAACAFCASSAGSWS